jgi:hypothetical protein
VRPIASITAAESVRTGRLVIGLFHTLSTGKRLHVAGLGVTDGVGVAVGLGLGDAVGLAVGAAVGEAEGPGVAVAFGWCVGCGFAFPDPVAVA